MTLLKNYALDAEAGDTATMADWDCGEFAGRDCQRGGTAGAVAF